MFVSLILIYGNVKTKDGESFHQSCKKGTVVGPELRPQNLLVLQGTLQGWLHLHVAELGDGEVQVLQCF